MLPWVGKCLLLSEGTGKWGSLKSAKTRTTKPMTWTAKYWTASEFACDRPESPCDCGLTEVHPELIRRADEIRSQIGVALRCTSGIRCREKNQTAGGAKRSLHLASPELGYAMDITYARRSLRTPLSIARLALTVESVCRDLDIGMGLYGGWVHFDVRGLTGMPPARWGSPHFPWDSLT